MQSTNARSHGTSGYPVKSPEETAASLARAASLIAAGKFPRYLRATIMGHTITLEPSGSTDKGAVSYKGRPGNISVVTPAGESKTLRLNRLSVSILGEHQAEVGIDLGEGDVW